MRYSGMGISLLLRIAAVVLFILAAIGINSKINFVAAGLACWCGSTLTM